MAAAYATCGQRSNVTICGIDRIGARALPEDQGQRR
jgi:hypothetical protein